MPPLKTIIDIRYLSAKSPSYLLFNLNLIEALSRAGMLGECLLLSETKKSILPGGLPVRHLSKMPFEWLNGLLLKRVLKKHRCRRYIRIQNYSWMLFTAANNGRLNVQKLPSLLLNFLTPPSGKGVLANVAMHKLIPTVPCAVHQLLWADMQEIKTAFSGGKDYFVFAGDIAAQHHLVDLLKAFSAFKKRQQSNMMLLIAGSSTHYTPFLEEQLATYKYRDDVAVIKDPPLLTLQKLVAAAYAVVHPSVVDSWPQSLMLAVQQGTCIIASNIPGNRSITEAAIWVDNSNITTGFYEGMQLLYRDERQKQELVRRMSEEIGEYTYDELLNKMSMYLA